MSRLLKGDYKVGLVLIELRVVNKIYWILLSIVVIVFNGNFRLLKVGMG